MRAAPRLGVSLRALLPEEEAAARSPPSATLRSNPGEGDSQPVALAEITPHPDPLPASGGREEKSNDDTAKPLLLVEKLVKEYPRQGPPAILTKLVSPQPPVGLGQVPAGAGIS